MSTEEPDPRFVDIDLWPTELAIETMLEGQLAAVAAVKVRAPAIASAVEAGAARLRQGGRLIYAGAGTSGRLAVQDGVELSPTFDWPAERLVFLLAGGMDALAASSEGAEDDAAAARHAADNARIGPNDVLIGVAASGRTPFTLAAMDAARSAGALTIGLANNPGTPLLAISDHPLLADTGSEPIAGSTRMKAGTAQKVMLNLLSTGMMLRCGFIYRGLMVNMRVSNDKLLHRARDIVGRIAGVNATIASSAVDAAGKDIRKAVLIASGAGADEAAALLRQTDNDLRAALDLAAARRDLADA